MTIQLSERLWSNATAKKNSIAQRMSSKAKENLWLIINQRVYFYFGQSTWFWDQNIVMQLDGVHWRSIWWDSTDILLPFWPSIMILSGNRFKHATNHLHIYHEFNASWRETHTHWTKRREDKKRKLFIHPLQTSELRWSHLTQLFKLIKYHVFQTKEK